MASSHHKLPMPSTSRRRMKDGTSRRVITNVPSCLRASEGVRRPSDHPSGAPRKTALRAAQRHPERAVMKSILALDPGVTTGYAYATVTDYKTVIVVGQRRFALKDLNDVLFRLENDSHVV